MPADQTFVIVGASLAGAKAAETLREEGFDGRVVLLGRRGRAAVRAAAAVQGLPARRDDRQAVRARRGVLRRPRDRAADLDRGRGDRPRRRRGRARATASGSPSTACCSPPAPSPAASTCRARSRRHPYLRDIETPTRSRDRIEAGGRLVTIGAGWIGAEVAASARAARLRGDGPRAASLPLERVLGPELGPSTATSTAITAWSFSPTRRRGDRGPAAVERRAHGRRARDRRRLRGRRRRRAPRDPARRGGRPGRSTTGSWSTRTCGRACPAIHAAGDVANALHPLYGERIRVEHWANALSQGPAAARNMLGKDGPTTTSPTSSPTSTTSAWSTPATRPSGTRSSSAATSRRGVRRLLGRRRPGLAGMNVNVWDVNDDIQALIRSQATVDRGRLADPDVPIAELASVGS